MGGCQAAHDLCRTLKETWVILGTVVQPGLYLSLFLGLRTHLCFLSRRQGGKGASTKTVLPRTEGNKMPLLCASPSIPPDPSSSGLGTRGIRTLWDARALEFVWQMRRPGLREGVRLVQSKLKVGLKWQSRDFFVVLYESDISFCINRGKMWKIWTIALFLFSKRENLHGYPRSGSRKSCVIVKGSPQTA